MSSNTHPTLARFLQALQNLNAEAIHPLKSDGCTHHFLPLSTQTSPMNNSQYAAYLELLQSKWKNFRVTLHDSMFDSRKKVICAWVSTSAESDVGKADNEHILWLQLSGDEKLITNVREFSDSHASKMYYRKLKEYMRWAKI